MLPSIFPLILLCFATGPAAWPGDSYISEIQNWRKEHDRDLLGPDGPFTFVARFLPKRGNSSIGRDRANDLLYLIEKAPAHVGNIDWPGGDRAILHLDPDAGAVLDGNPVKELEIPQPVTITIGEMQLLARFRESELRITVRDPNARIRKEAKPSVWYAIDQRYRMCG